jgi:hypothetical protein
MDDEHLQEKGMMTGRIQQKVSAMRKIGKRYWMLLRIQELMSWMKIFSREVSKLNVLMDDLHEGGRTVR